MNVETLMTTPAITCTPDERLAVAAQRMWDGDCGALPVVTHEGVLIGMITDRDICMCAWFQGRPLGDIAVAEAMCTQVASIRGNQDVFAVERLMASREIRRVPVVDAANHVIGIVSINDIAREECRPNSKLQQYGIRALETLATITKPRASSRRRAA